MRKRLSSKLRRMIEAPHAVVGEDAAELVEEARGEALAASVEVAQVGEEVLLGAVPPVAGPLAGVAAEERADVREREEDLLFQVQAGVGAMAQLARDEALHRAGAGVVAEHEAAGLLQALGAGRRGRFEGLEEVFEADFRHVRGRSRVGGGGRLQDEERAAGADLGIAAREDLADAAGHGSHQGGLHLHGFEHGERSRRRPRCPLPGRRARPRPRGPASARRHPRRAPAGGGRRRSPPAGGCPGRRGRPASFGRRRRSAGPCAREPRPAREGGARRSRCGKAVRRAGRRERRRTGPCSAARRSGRSLSAPPAGRGPPKRRNGTGRRRPPLRTRPRRPRAGRLRRPACGRCSPLATSRSIQGEPSPSRPPRGGPGSRPGRPCPWHRRAGRPRCGRARAGGGPGPRRACGRER